MPNSTELLPTIAVGLVDAEQAEMSVQAMRLMPALGQTTPPHVEPVERDSPTPRPTTE